MAVTSPMFPLGSVLLPGSVLPLHVFESRYRRLVLDCLAGTPEFGVVLIDRGSEVGGGEVRRSVGTVAQIVEATQLHDGRWALVTMGKRRVRVTGWLDDDPYPRADLADWPDPAVDATHVDLLTGTVAVLRRVLARSAELGDRVPSATTTLADDPITAGYQACALAPLGPLDTYALLEAPDHPARMELLAAMLADIEQDLMRRIDLDGRAS